MSSARMTMKFGLRAGAAARAEAPAIDWRKARRVVTSGLCHTPPRIADPDDTVKVVERQTRELIGGFLAATAALILFAWLSTQVFRNSTIAFDSAVRDGLH